MDREAEQPNISRRNFLAIMGGGATLLTFGGRAIACEQVEGQLDCEPQAVCPQIGRIQVSRIFTLDSNGDRHYSPGEPAWAAVGETNTEVEIWGCEDPSQRIHRLITPKFNNPQERARHNGLAADIKTGLTYFDFTRDKFKHDVVWNPVTRRYEVVFTFELRKMSPNWEIETDPITGEQERWFGCAYACDIGGRLIITESYIATPLSQSTLESRGIKQTSPNIIFTPQPSPWPLAKAY